MPKLLLNFNGTTQNEYQLEQEEITIGRKPDNDIHIDNRAVSNQHARILTILNDAFIEDLDSTNGTRVNGEKINKQALNNGDIIRIGNCTLTYIGEADDDCEFNKTMIIRPDAQGMPETEETDRNIGQSIGKIADDLATAEISTANLGIARLQLMSGANNGKELVLTKALTTLGDPGVQVAAITRRPTGYFLIIIDTGKQNKMPQLNGNAVGKQALQLHNGDIIEVAGIKMGFFLSARAEKERE